MDTPYKRLKFIADKYFENLSKLSIKIGKSDTFFSGYRNQKGIGKRILKDLQDICSINPRYIEYGDLPIFLNDEVPTGMVREKPYEYIAGMRVENIRSIDMNLSKEELERLAKIKLYSVSAQAYEAKTLCDFSDIPISSIALNVGIPLDPEKYIAVRVSGFSMKDAGIQDGDIILVDTSRKEIVEGKIFLLALNGMLMVKRIVLDGETITLVSANNGIEPFIVNHTDDVLVIHGQVRITLKYNY